MRTYFDPVMPHATAMHPRPHAVHRFIAIINILAQVLVGLPLTYPTTGYAAELPAFTSSPALPPPVRTPDNIKANRSLPSHQPATELATLNSNPTDSDLNALRLFPHRLAPVAPDAPDAPDAPNSLLKSVGQWFGNGPGTTAMPDENRALASHITSIRNSNNPHAIEPLQAFIQSHPKSRWAPSVRHELARRLFAQGYFPRAIAEWESLWKQLRDRRDPGSLAVGDEVLAHLIEACMGMSDSQRLTDLIGAAEARPLNNLLEAKLARAKQSVWLLKHKGGQNVLCGPLALYAILRHEARPFEPIRLDTITDDYIATGLPLTELRAFGDRYQLGLTMVKRPAGADIPVPAVMHTSSGHYATLVQREGDQYFLVDSAMQFEGWIPQSAVDEQSSGYFLVRSKDVPPGWDRISDAEGRNVFGRDGLHGQEPNGPNSPDCNQGAGGDSGGGCCGMARYSFNAKLASVRIEDIPVGYAPPVGPGVYFRVAYKDLDDSKPATSPAFSNVGRVWAIDWIAWVDHVAGALTSSSRATVHVAGGGTEVSTYVTSTGKFGPNDRSFTTLTRSGTSTYTREMPDGSREIYDTPDNPAAPNRVFLSQKVDPSGNTIRFTYDSNLRLIAVTDAIGQVTTLEHNLPSDIWKITKVTDPFGRFATLQYDATGRLTNITDVINLSSSFTYSASDFITSMTTPYGTTTFTLVQGSPAYNRTVTATDPMGQQERIQFIEPIDLPTTAPSVPPTVNVGGVNVPFRAETARLGFRNSFFWSKQAMQQAPGDVRVARNYRWFTDARYLVTGVLESVKEPLEDPVWYNYPNQITGGFPYYAGEGSIPNKSLRMLPDGTPQLFQTYYNRLGMTTNYIDPLGRSTFLLYAANGLDLVEVRQQTATNRSERISQLTYAAPGLPSTYTDAAGKTWQFAYNNRGQLLSATNPAGLARIFTYDNRGYLIQINDWLSGSQDSIRFSYDGFGRVRTETDSDGYVVTYDYDALDRVTLVSYADASTEQVSYNRLDVVNVKDRLGRVTRFTYDALQRVTSVQDGLNRTTRFEWCSCGDLGAVVDPMNRVTTWRHDLQGRVIAKEFGDGSSIQFEYESGTSRVKRVVDAQGQFTEFNYQVDDAISRISYPNAKVPTASVDYAYESAYKRLASFTDATGVTRFAYHPITGGVQAGAGMLSSVDGPLPNDTVQLDYDDNGRVRSRLIGNGGFAAETLDGLDRRRASTNNLGNFAYDYELQSSRPTSVTRPNGVQSTFSYSGNTANRRLNQIGHSRGASSISRYTHGFDSQANLVEWTLTQTGGSSSVNKLKYDAADQLTNIVTTPSAGGDQVSSFAYDASGNRTLEIKGTATRTFAYNALNEVTSSSVAPARDETYEWDGAHRLTAINRASGRTEFTYNAQGQRTRIVERQNGNVTSDKRYVWLGLALCEERDATGNAVEKRFFDEGEQHLTGPSAGSYYYTRDHLGSIREMTDSTGNVRAQYSYDVWGARTKTQGDLEAAFGFTGHFHHGPTGLSLAFFRAYSPELGRWLNRDPLGELGGVNLFAYAGNNPAGRVDPLGLWFGVDDAVFAGGGALIGLGGQLVGDLVNSGMSGSWQFSGWEDYAASAVGGAVAGEVLLYAGPIAAGAAGGAAGNLTRQGLKNLTGKQCGFDWGSFVGETGIGAATGLIPGIPVRGVTTGRNSYNAIYRQISTKARNGTISSIRGRTAAKMFLGRTTDTSFGPGAVAAGAASVFAPNSQANCPCR